jgi:(p)ppGpp synthase/HD superfamily hydrolase
MPGEEVSQAKQQLKVIIEAYLKDSDIQSVLAACDFADLAHSGITRKSGEPYIYHPLAVAKIAAEDTADIAAWESSLEPNMKTDPCLLEYTAFVQKHKELT